MRTISALVTLSLLLPGTTLAEPLVPKTPTIRHYSAAYTSREVTRYTNLRGWEHLFSRLLDYGVEAEEFASIFQDKRIPKFDGLHFNVNPKEPRSIYRGANIPERNKRALKFFEANAQYFEQAERRFGVPQSIVLAIIQMETNSGAFTGKSGVLYGLARLAAASDPANIERVYRQTKKSNPSVTRQQVAKRAQYLEDTFLPHVAATVQVARDMGVHPLELRGSHSGAIGLPQFLPENVIRYGIDADKSGKVNLFTGPDAILSTANFLASHGWNSETKTVSQKRAIIWNYNRSEPYIDSILEISSSLHPRMLAMRTAKRTTNN